MRETKKLAVTGGQTVTTDAEEADEDQGDDTADTFPREYVEELRRENARYRERARNADTYAKRLHTELVPPAGWPIPPTSSSATTIWTTPTHWPPPSTTY